MRFSIRDLLWATLVVAMGLGWWLEHRAHGETEAKRLAAVEQARRLRTPLELIKANLNSTSISHVLEGHVDWRILNESLVEP